MLDPKASHGRVHSRLESSASLSSDQFGVCRNFRSREAEAATVVAGWHAMASITTVSLNCLMGWLLFELLLLSDDEVRSGPELQGNIHVLAIVMLRRVGARRHTNFSS